MKLRLTLLSLRVTTLTRLFVSDPKKFIGQVGERLNIPPLRKVSNKPAASSAQRSAEKLVGRGEYTQAAAIARGPQRTSITGELELLTTAGLLGTTLAPKGELTADTAAGTDGIRSLHFLTNSLPHTQSGYSLRSHAALRAIRAEGIGVHAATRIAYPVTVGKTPRTPIELVDGIGYERLLPRVFPAQLTDRHEKTARMLAEVARREGSTILHTTTDFRNGLIVHAAANQLGIPWVYEARGEMEKTWLSRIPAEKQAQVEQSEFYRLARAQEARVAAAADAVVALSEVSARQLVERGVDASRIILAPNAVNDALLDRQVDPMRLRTELGLPDGLLVGAITAVVGYEGLDTLVASIEHLPDDARVLIVGDGTARPELEQLARDLHVSDRVIFAGRQPANDIWRWYGALDVFAVPRHDTAVSRSVTPIKPLNALALGIPVVTSDLPALREVTGGTSTYCRAGDPEDLARAILEAAASDPEPGREFARTRTWSANGRSYRDLYVKLCDEYAG